MSGETLSRCKRILVVDDEPIVLTVAGRMLQEAGYEVVPARDGHEALKALSNGHPVDLILSDVMMPNLGGGALAQRFEAQHPGIPVIWMSGYPRDIVFRESSSHFRSYLQKPLRHEELLRIVAQHFD